MAITVTRNIKGRNETLYAKIKGMSGNKNAMWCKVGFFWDAEAADDTKIDHELDTIEVPFKPDFTSESSFWAQAYDAVKDKLELLGYENIADEQ